MSHRKVLSALAMAPALGKTIRNIEVKDDVLAISFEDGAATHLTDDGQDCCEKRYMVCDDNLSHFKGAKLLMAEVTDVKQHGCDDVDSNCDAHDIQFLVVTTSKGSFTVSNHNEHNGYYGGFYIVVRHF